MTPGNVGHQWIKSHWKIGVNPPNKAFTDPVSKRKRIYIPATIDNNPTLMKTDLEYVNFLETLPEPLRSAWRHGDWDIFAGQYFTEWNTSKHIVDKDIATKLGFGREYNKRYLGIDWGFANPFACVWIEVTPNNRVFCYKELYGTEKHPSEWGQDILNMIGD